ncbi:hypothetical protein J6590_000092 [Homalodisca vitripennis]|nr:hypothetical protein J6590_000092 [Homalodisca vitripennis]
MPLLRSSPGYLIFCRYISNRPLPTPPCSVLLTASSVKPVDEGGYSSLELQLYFASCFSRETLAAFEGKEAMYFVGAMKLRGWSKCTKRYFIRTGSQPNKTHVEFCVRANGEVFVYI